MHNMVAYITLWLTSLSCSSTVSGHCASSLEGSLYQSSLQSGNLRSSLSRRECIYQGVPLSVVIFNLVVNTLLDTGLTWATDFLIPLAVSTSSSMPMMHVLWLIPQPHASTFYTSPLTGCSGQGWHRNTEVPMPFIEKLLGEARWPPTHIKCSSHCSSWILGGTGSRIPWQQGRPPGQNISGHRSVSVEKEAEAAPLLGGSVPTNGLASSHQRVSLNLDWAEGWLPTHRLPEEVVWACKVDQHCSPVSAKITWLPGSAYNVHSPQKASIPSVSGSFRSLGNASCSPLRIPVYSSWQITASNLSCKLYSCSSSPGGTEDQSRGSRNIWWKELKLQGQRILISTTSRVSRGKGSWVALVQVVLPSGHVLYNLCLMSNSSLPLMPLMLMSFHPMLTKIPLKEEARTILSSLPREPGPTACAQQLPCA